MNCTDEDLAHSNDQLDDWYMCSCLRRPLEHKRLLLEQLRIQREKSRNGDTADYPVAAFRFETRIPRNMPFLFTEIFIAEPYFFETTDPNPLIIDGGVNIGVSVAYFKWLYPNARIIGFEPFPAAYEVACQNARANRLADVELLNSALAAKAGQAVLNYLDDDMASTLSNRLAMRNQPTQQIAVSTVTLSSYLNEKVHFLKLDIEGTEYEVLREAENKLKNVQNLFIEFHSTLGDTVNSLPQTLELLTRNGFHYLITPSLHFRRGTTVMPWIKLNSKISSLHILAKRIH